MLPLPLLPLPAQAECTKPNKNFTPDRSRPGVLFSVIRMLRLPLTRELSAKLTEGEIFDGQIYIFTYTTKIAVNIHITNS